LFNNNNNNNNNNNRRRRRHVPEELVVFPVPWSSKWSWFVHLFFGRPMFLRPFGLHRNACFGILFVSILCTCCSHFLWYCFISSTMFCVPVFPPIHWFFSLSSFVIPGKCCLIFKRKFLYQTFVGGLGKVSFGDVVGKKNREALALNLWPLQRRQTTAWC